MSVPPKTPFKNGILLVPLMPVTQGGFPGAGLCWVQPVCGGKRGGSTCTFYRINVLQTCPFLRRTMSSVKKMWMGAQLRKASAGGGGGGVVVAVM